MNPHSLSWLRRGGAAAILCALGFSLPAHAIPAFARKYGTSCETCHTVYPKLTPFGEAFRRNGYRFPGTDSDYWKQDHVAMGQEAYKKTFPNSVWPGWVAGSPPLAFGFNGTVPVSPDNNVTGAPNHTNFSLQGLTAEAHLWAGGSYDDKITYWGEVTFGSDGTIDVEKAEVLVNDLIGPQHAVNVIVGRGVGNVSSFGPHSSYLSDSLIPSIPVTGLVGSSSDPFNIGDNYEFVEANGVLAGRFLYNVGITAGKHPDIRPTENVYGHLGYKLGGIRMDGEGTSGPPDPQRPWAETALTLDAFVYKSVSHFVTPFGQAAATAANTTALAQQDSAWTYGGALRAQWGSLELNSGVYWEDHSNALDPSLLTANGGLASELKASAFVQYDELSYTVFPWLVPALRVEWSTLTPNGYSTVYNTRLFPGVAMLIRPNLKLVVFGQIEFTNGPPPTSVTANPDGTFTQNYGSWGPAGAQGAPTGPGTMTEFESINFWLATAF